MQFDLIEIALKDLKASSLLYEKKLHAQSFFYFQQASEKANKAFGLSNGIITEDELKKNIQHNQLKIHKRAIVSEQEELNKFTHYLKTHSDIANHEFVKTKQIEAYSKALEEGVRFHDSANNNQSLLNYSKADLLFFLDYISELYYCKIKPTKEFSEAILKELNVYNDFASKFFSENEKRDLEEALKSENEQAILNLSYKVAENLMKYLFSVYTFYFCALITIKHNNITRYPDGTTNPLNFYNKKNLSVKYQPYFIFYLRKAILLYKKIIVENKSQQNE